LENISSPRGPTFKARSPARSTQILAQTLPTRPHGLVPSAPAEPSFLLQLNSAPRGHLVCHLWLVCCNFWARFLCHFLWFPNISNNPVCRLRAQQVGSLERASLIKVWAQFRAQIFFYKFLLQTNRVANSAVSQSELISQVETRCASSSS